MENHGIKNPSEVVALLQQAADYFQQGRLEEAKSLAERILELSPNHADATHLLGIIAGQREQYDLACRLIAGAIKRNPDQPKFHYNFGYMAQMKGHLQEALVAYRRAVQLDPKYAVAHNNLGIVCNKLGKFNDAIICHRKALSLKPDYTEAYNNLGFVFLETGEYARAIDCYRQALSLQPGNAEIHCNLAIAFREQGQYDQAISCYRQALSFKPDYVDAHLKLGNTYREQRQYNQAIDCYRQALSIKPDYLEAYNNLGVLFRMQGRIEEANASFQQALRINPDDLFARWSVLLALPVLYDSFEQIDSVRNRWIEGVHELLKIVDLHSPEGIKAARDAVACSAFYLNYQGQNDLETQVLFGRLLTRIANAAYPHHAGKKGHLRLQTGDRIRVGFVSSYFYNHSIFKTHGRWITKLNKQEFEVSVFYAGHVNDWATAEISSRADHFFTTRNTAELIRTIAGQKLDVLVYTDLGMEPHLQLASALRLAPVQCNGGGHPVTSGLPTMDYFLGSDLMEPAVGNSHYSEELVRLPGLASSYPCPRVGKAVIPPGVQRDPGRVVFLNLQSLYKLLPQHDDLYPRIAQQVPGCQFWFIGGMSDFVTNQFRRRLGKAFARHGLDAEDYCRLHPQMSQYEFFGLAKSADVILDGITWSGNNSSLEALAFDKPIVTVPGQMFRSRHSYAILKKIDAGDTIAVDLEDYIRIAVRLGLDKSFRSAVKQKIAQNKGLAYDDPEVIRGLEEFFRSSVNREGCK